MADDNRLPTNQSQIDIEAALQDVKTAIANLNFILDAQNIAYDSNTSVKNKIDSLSNKFTVIQSTTPSSTGTNSSWNFPTNQGFTYQNSIIVGFNVYRSQNTRYYNNASDYAIAWVDLANGNAGGRVLLVDSNYSDCQCDIILMRTDI